MCDGFFVFIVRGPYCNFVSFGSDVNDGSTNVIAVIIKGFTDKTQELQEKHTSFPHALLLGRTSFFKADILTSHRRKSTSVTLNNDSSVPGSHDMLQ